MLGAYFEREVETSLLSRSSSCCTREASHWRKWITEKRAVSVRNIFSSQRLLKFFSAGAPEGIQSEPMMVCSRSLLWVCC